MQIKYVDHPHVLSYNEATEQHKSLLCNACCQEVFGQHYACEDCEYYLHETCTTLPYEVSHPLHRQHPLKLFADIGEFPCYQCGDHSGGFFYICYPCDFKLDLKCAMTPIAPNKEGPRQIEMERLSKLCPFNQNHKLEFFNRRANLIKDLKCYACLLPIVGSAYRCRECFYTYVHESCLALVREMQHPFHPLHLLHPQIFSSMFDQQNFSWMWSVSCFACGNTIDIGYGCQKCDFRLHFNCAYSLKRALKYKSHIHNLYYFGLRAEKRARACNKCKSLLDGEPFYHCMECGISLHIKCVPIPHLIKSKSHIHSLTLKDYFVEDGSGEYYCDICEEERNSKNHVYYCEECDGQFVAHIECMLHTKGLPKELFVVKMYALTTEVPKKVVKTRSKA
ncbi:DC1 - like 10 [Theobroma cacao]|nr:DC1 - like 10 [Theobroma cacao]